MLWLLLVLPALAAGQNPCGFPLNQKSSNVIGGEDAPRGAWPWQAAMEWAFTPSAANWNHYCGGSLLSEGWAITAAHCVTSLAAGERVVFGQLERNNWVGEEVAVPFSPSDVFIHPDYRGFVPYEADVALIRLNPPLNLAQLPQLAPACLPSNPTYDFAGQDCVITGWGVTQFGGSAPNHLQQGFIEVISNAECVATGPPISSTTDTNICIFDREDQSTISCSGDSGGPLNCLVNGRYEMAGTSSWGFTGCPTTVPRVYHRTTYVLDWIKGITGIE